MLQIMEVLILLNIVVVAILSALPRRRFGLWSFRGAILATFFSLLDLVLGHGRWQMVPVEMLCLLLLGFTFYRTKFESGTSVGWASRVGFFMCLATGGSWLAIAVLIPLAFPMFEPPTPTGSYGVGYTDIYLTDNSRLETMAPDRDDTRRELVVRAWYPSDIPDGVKPLPFMSNIKALQATFSGAVPLPAFVWSHMQKILGHSYADTPLSSDSGTAFPVLVFNHGMGAFGTINTLMLQNLASHGYVVFSLERPYHSTLIEFPDGRIIPYNADWMAPNDDAMAVSVTDQLLYMANTLYAESYDQYLMQIAGYLEEQSTLDQGLRLWVEDTAFILDLLARAGVSQYPKIDQFSGRLDLGKIGVFGMSFGGATAGAFCARDNRCKAGINMDGLQFGAYTKPREFILEKPFLMMNGDRRIDYKNYLGPEMDWNRPLPFEMNDFVYQQSNHVAYSLTVAGAAHYNFTDIGLISRLSAWVGNTGSVDLLAMNRIMNDYSLAFFNQHLRGRKEPLLDGCTKNYPDVTKFVRRDGRINQQ